MDEQPKKKTSKLIVFMTSAFIFFVVIVGVFSISFFHDYSTQMWCWENLTTLRCVMQDDYLLTDNWCDDLLAKSSDCKDLFTCKVAKKGPCDYALNRQMLNLTVEEVPADMVLIFESNPGWNQVGGVELLSTDNHKGKGCNILFGDLTARFIKTEELSKLKWEVE